MSEQKEGSLISITLTKIKQSLFSFSSLVLQNNVVNTPLYLLMIVIEIFQISPFLLSIALRISDGNPQAIKLYANIMDIIFTYSLNKSITCASLSAVFAFAISFICAFASAICILVYLGSKQQSKTSEISQGISCLMKFISFAVMSFCTYLSFPAITLLMLSYNCVGVNGTQYFYNNLSVQCWQGLHLAVVILNSCNFILFFTGVIIIETLVNETGIKSTIPWACTEANSVRHINHVIRTVLIGFYFLDPQAALYNYFFATEIILTALCIYWLFVCPKYINRLVGNVTIYIQSFIFVLLVWSYIVRLSGSVILYPGAVMLGLMCFFIPFLVIFAKDVYEQYIRSLLPADTKFSRLKEYYLYEYFNLLLDYASGDTQSAITLNGIYANHQINCRNPVCRSKSHSLNQHLAEVKAILAEDENRDLARLQGNDEIEKQKCRRWDSMSTLFQIGGSNKSPSRYSPLNESSEAGGIVITPEEVAPTQLTNNELLFNLGTSMIDFEMKNDPICVTTRMISAYYNKDFIRNLFRAAYDLYYIKENLKPSFRESFLVYKTMQDIDEEILVFAQKKEGDSKVDVESIIQFEEHYSNFRSNSENAANYANRFWGLLKSRELDINGLYDVGSKIGELYNDMQKNYQFAIEMFPQNHKLVREFGYFEKYIMNNDAIANTYELEAKRIFKEATYGEQISTAETTLIELASIHHTCICLASANPESLGNILSINNEVQYSLGFKPKDIIDQNCIVLCPPYIGQKHNAMIENFFKVGFSDFIGELRNTIAIDSKGFLVVLEMMVKIVPTILKGIRFLISFKKFNNFSDYFSNSLLQVTPGDFGLIVTNLDGNLLGINETCMTTLGIPASLFKGKSLINDSVTIQNLIKELNEPEIMEELKSEGRVVEIDTSTLLGLVNRENLSTKEVELLESKVGKYSIFLKVVTESYSKKMVTINIWRIVILSQSQIMEKEALTKGKEKAITLTKLPYLEQNKEFDTEEATNLQEDNEEKGLNEAKNTINSHSSEVNVSVIYFWVNFIMVIILAIACTELGLLLAERSSQIYYTNVMFTTNQRILYSNLITASVFTNVNMTNSTTTPEKPLGVNLYEYLREYGTRSISILSAAEQYMNTAGFDYTPTLYNLEKKSSMSMITLGMYNQITKILYTMNTALTQFMSKSSDFMSYDFNSLRQQVYMAQFQDTIFTDFFFVIQNGLGALANATQSSELEFTSTIKSRIGYPQPYLVGACVLVSVALLICFAFTVPKLIGIQEEKIHILILYSQFNKKEIDRQIDKCLKYQKLSGNYEETENTEKQELLSKLGQEQSNPFMESQYNITPEEKKTPIPAEEKPAADPQINAEKSSDEDDESNEGKPEEIPEDEKRICDGLDLSQIRSKLTSNKCWLIISSILVATIVCCYVFYNVIEEAERIVTVKEMIDMIHGISGMIKSQILLVLYSLVSVTTNTTFYVGSQDAVAFYLNDFIVSNSFSQTLASSSSSYISSTQTYFKLLDSSSFCNTLQGFFGNIQNTYSSNNFTYTKTITSSICSAYESGLLTQGITQASFLVHQVVNAIQNQRMLKVTPQTKDAVSCLYMIEMFIAPAYEGLLLLLSSSIGNYFSGVLSLMAYFFAFYFVLAIIAHFFFWTCFFNMMTRELVKSRGMLKLMPLELIKKLKEMKKEDQNGTNATSLQFFKEIQKKH